MDAENCLDFDLLIGANPGGGYRARVVSSPAGVAGCDFTLPFSDLEIENLILRMGQVRSGLRRRESPQTQAAAEFGRRLFTAVFGGEIDACWRSSLASAGQQNARLRVRLRLSDAPELLDLPWEYLYDSSSDRFVAFFTKTPLIRYLDLPGRIELLPVTPPLRILVLIASPHDLEALDVEREWNNLHTALADLETQGLVQIVRCPAPTLAELQRTLRRQECHIFHFVGHGGYDDRERDGLLLFEDEQGRGLPVSGRQLGALLHDEGQLRLVVLNACEGGRTSRVDPFAGVGQSLLQQGVPAVIAMQFAITDVAAATFAREFYAAVADGYPVDSALAEARKAIFAQSESVEWGTPVLYMRTSAGNVFDLSPQPAAPLNPMGALPAPPPVAAVATPRPAPARSHTGMWVALAAALTAAVLLALFVLQPPFGREARQTPLPPAFAYSFDSGDIDGWTGNPTYWRAVQDETGNYVYQGTAPPGGDMATELPNKATMATWRDYRVDFRLRLLRRGSNQDFPETWVTTRAPYEDTAQGCTFYNSSFNFRAQVIGVSKGGNEQVCPFTILANNGFALKPKVWYNVSISMQGDQIRLTIDGERVIDTQDSDVKQGYVYLTVSHNAVVQYDDFRVYKTVE